MRKWYGSTHEYPGMPFKEKARLACRYIDTRLQLTQNERDNVIERFPFLRSLERDLQEIARLCDAEKANNQPKG